MEARAPGLSRITACFGRPMPDNDPQQLRPTTPGEIAETLPYALRHDGRRRIHDADDAMARITAQRVVEHLERSGFVLMRRPPAGAPSVPGGGGPT